MDQTMKKTKKTRGAGIVPNKAMEIRRAAKSLSSQGQLPRPKTIRELLGGKGIKVSSAQVSMALKDTEFAYRRNQTPGERPQLLPDPLEAVRQISPEDLPRAREFARIMGSTQRAIAALVALGQFREPEPEQEYYGGA